MATKHTIKLGSVIPRSISFHSHGTPRKKTLYPQFYWQRNQNAEMLSQSPRWLPDFRTGLCAKKSHGQVHRKCTVPLFTMELKRILSRRQQTFSVTLKYLELESLCCYCQPSEFLYSKTRDLSATLLVFFSFCFCFNERNSSFTKIPYKWAQFETQLKSKPTSLVLEKRNVVADFIFCTLSLKKAILWVKLPSSKLFCENSFKGFSTV